MKVKAKMNHAAVRSLSEAQAKAVVMTAQQMLNETRNDGMMPFDTGNLQNESTYVDDSRATKGEVTIVTDTPYARRLYFHPEYNFNQSKNARAGGEWWEPWLTGNKKNRAKELFMKFYEKLVGGTVK